MLCHEDRDWTRCNIFIFSKIILHNLYVRSVAMIYLCRWVQHRRLHDVCLWLLVYGACIAQCTYARYKATQFCFMEITVKLFIWEPYWSLWSILLRKLQLSSLSPIAAVKAFFYHFISQINGRRLIG